MRYLVTSIFVFFIGNELTAQRFIPNTASFKVHAGMNLIFGNAIVKEGDYVAPSMLNNFRQAYSIGMSGSMKLKKQIYGRIRLNHLRLSDWQFEEAGELNDKRFSGTKFSSIELQPMIGLTTKVRKTGLLQHFNFSAYVGPTFNRNVVSLAYSVFQTNVPDTDLTSSAIYSIGVAGSGNIDVIVSNRSMIGVSFDYMLSKISSGLFDDTEFSSLAVCLSYGYRLSLDKRYKYSM
jgi:hypothetical protein